MTPITFPEANQIFKKPESMTDEQCVPLAVHNDGTQIVSCWEMSAEEKLQALFFGRLWISVIGQSLPPMWMRIDKTVFTCEGNAPDSDFLENYKKRKIRQFYEQRIYPMNLDAGIKHENLLIQSEHIEKLLQEFLQFLFEDQK